MDWSLLLEPRGQTTVEVTGGLETEKQLLVDFSQLLLGGLVEIHWEWGIKCSNDKRVSFYENYLKIKWDID